MGQEPQFERKDVEKTPFSIYIKDGLTARIAVGTNWVTEELENEEAARKLIKERDWWLIMNTVSLYCEYAYNAKVSERKEAINA